MTDATQVAVIAKLIAVDGKRDDLFHLIEGLIDTVRDEPGTLVYGLHADTGDDNVAWSFELYRDQAAYDAHASGQARVALEAITERLNELLAAPPEVHSLVPGPGIGLPSRDRVPDER
jgi:quinol monooxygenase YgiN